MELSRFYHGDIYRRYSFSGFKVSGGQSSGGSVFARVRQASSNEGKVSGKAQGYERAAVGR